VCRCVRSRRAIGPSSLRDGTDKAPSNRPAATHRPYIAKASGESGCPGQDRSTACRQPCANPRALNSTTSRRTAMRANRCPRQPRLIASSSGPHRTRWRRASLDPHEEPLPLGQATRPLRSEANLTVGATARKPPGCPDRSAPPTTPGSPCLDHGPTGPTPRSSGRRTFQDPRWPHDPPGSAA